VATGANSAIFIGFLRRTQATASHVIIDRTIAFGPNVGSMGAMRSAASGKPAFEIEASMNFSFVKGFHLPRRSAVEVSRSTAAWIASFTNAVTACDTVRDVDRWMKYAFDGRATVYSHAMDAEYIRTHIGGAWHRLFDGGHDLIGAWRAVRGAVPNDTVVNELQAYIRELWKDLVTPNGLPLFTWDHATYKSFQAALTHALHVNHAWVNDLVSYTATDLGGGIAALAALLLNLKATDPHRYYDVCGSIGVSAVIAANPIVMAIAIISLLRAAQQEQKPARPWARFRRSAAFARGIIAAGLTILVMGAIGGAIGVVAGLVVSIAVRIVLKWSEEKLRERLSRISTVVLLLECSSAGALMAPTPSES